MLLLHPFADFLIHLWGFIRTPHRRSEVLWLVSVCDVEKQKTVSSSPPRGKSYGKQSLWDLLLCPSWPKTTLGRDCMLKWASAGASGFIQVMEQPGKVGAHYLLWSIKRSLYHRAFESAFNGFSSWLWFLTGCGPGGQERASSTPKHRSVFFSLLLWEADQVAIHTCKKLLSAEWRLLPLGYAFCRLSGTPGTSSF